MTEFFAAPEWLWAAALLPIVFACEHAWAKSWSAKRVRSFGERLASQSTATAPASPGAVTLATGLLVLAAMQPQWGTQVDPNARRGSDVVVCLDVSRSMLAADLAPSRLVAAQEDLRSLVESGLDDRFALLAFAGEARRLVPLTDDRLSFQQLIPLADPSAVRRGGTDLAAALELAFASLPEEAERTPTLVMLTDGEDLEGRALEVLQEAAASVAVHAVGYGTPSGSKIVVNVDGQQTFVKDRDGNDVITSLDGRSLRALAEASQGSYREARNDPGLVELRKSLQAQASVVDAGEAVERKTPRFTWPLLAAFLLLAWVGRGGRS